MQAPNTSIGLTGILFVLAIYGGGGLPTKLLFLKCCWANLNLKSAHVQSTLILLLVIGNGIILCGNEDGEDIDVDITLEIAKQNIQFIW